MEGRSTYDPDKHAYKRGRPPGSVKEDNEPLRDALRRWARAGRPTSLSALARELGVSKNRLAGIYWRMGLSRPRKPSAPSKAARRRPSAPSMKETDHAYE